MKANEFYLIKDLSFLTDLSVHTIRYYIKLGLIKEVGRTPATNFKYFDNSTLKDLKKIIKLKEDNFSLDKIAHILKSKERDL